MLYLLHDSPDHTSAHAHHGGHGEWLAHGHAHRAQPRCEPKHVTGGIIQARATGTRVMGQARWRLVWTVSLTPSVLPMVLDTRC
jgi:ABC-type nickel/cobalt efflux system permease component RcnA